MTKKLLKFALAAAGLMIAFYLCFQVYSIANPSYKTTVAVEYTVTDAIRCNGIAVRDESTMSAGDGGVVNYLVGNGEKVAMGAAVAEVYSNSSSAAADLIAGCLEDELEAY